MAGGCTTGGGRGSRWRKGETVVEVHGGGEQECSRGGCLTLALALTAWEGGGGVGWEGGRVVQVHSGGSGRGDEGSAGGLGGVSCMGVLGGLPSGVGAGGAVPHIGRPRLLESADLVRREAQARGVMAQATGVADEHGVTSVVALAAEAACTALGRDG